MKRNRMDLPPEGRPLEELRREMEERKRSDADWRGGRTFSLVYPAGEDVDEVLRAANDLYVFENALNPQRFPSLKVMERDVVGMTLGLLHGPDDAGGCMTSGGTESILMAVKTARNRAREERGITAPEMVVPISAHPAFAKAAELLGIEVHLAPLAPDLRVDVAAVADLIGDRTVLVVGSAPNYPHGMIDPIEDLASLALEKGCSFHTDACVGGFLLPFLEKLGEEIPPWDFRVEGVSTISADVHKYGYATKGASVCAHRDRATLKHQIFIYDAWPGGSYGSPALAGARPAAPIAAAWAVLSYLGEKGYLDLSRRAIGTARKLRRGIEAIDGLFILGNPPASLLAFASDSLDIMAVGDVMDDRGWCLDRQVGPEALHMMVSPEHDRVADRFLEDLREAVAHHGTRRASEARYN